MNKRTSSFNLVNASQILFIVLSTIFTLGIGPGVFGAVITVNNTNDNATSGDGLCTLREAIESANTDTTNGDCVAGSGIDTIQFSVSGTITLNSTLPNIVTSISIDGIGRNVTISGNNSVRIILVDPGSFTPSIFLDIKNLTLTKGQAQGQPIQNDIGGGAIFNQRQVVNVTNVTFSKNTVIAGPEAHGGAIHNNDGGLNVTNCRFEGNSANSSISVATGGAIAQTASGRLVVKNSVFTKNTVNGISSASGGGALHTTGEAFVTDSTFSNNTSFPNGGAITSTLLSIRSSTFFGNQATFSGGAIFISGTMDLTNATFSGNKASEGGAIFSFGAVLEMTNSTFSKNNASSRGGAIFYSNMDGGSLNITNSIFDKSPSGGNCSVLDPLNPPFITDGGNNLDSDGTCGFSSGITNPLLDVAGLQHNGGGTKTIALQSASPAIDAGNNTVCSADPVNGVDQRGMVRPQGFVCDIGAFELGQGCSHRSGYWKSNPSLWPVTSLTLGIQTYDQNELLNILNSTNLLDASVILAKELIASKLNFASGSEPFLLGGAINEGDKLLSGFSGKLPFNVKPSSSTGKKMILTTVFLGIYNLKKCEF